MKPFFKILNIVLSLNLCLAGIASSQTRLLSKGQFPILAWVGVPEEETTEARFLELKASGITHNFSFYTNAKALDRALAIAQKTGVKIIANCPELHADPEGMVKKLKNHPALAAYYLKDEPGTGEFPELGKWAKRIQAVDDKHFCYLNLLPTYASLEMLGAKSYRDYVHRFIQEVPLQLLSFDHYPIVGQTNNDVRADWYENLEIFADEARKANKPFWAFALTVAHTPYPRPTTAGLRLQVYSNLAYGAQGIQYFTYSTPVSTIWDFNHAAIGEGGKRTEVYDKVTQMNKEINALSGVFLGAKVLSIYHTGDAIPSGTIRLAELPAPIKKLATDGKGAVVSFIENGNRNFAVIVNKNLTENMNLTIEGESTLQKIMKDGSVVSASLYAPTTAVEPGDVAIYSWLK